MSTGVLNSCFTLGKSLIYSTPSITAFFAGKRVCVSTIQSFKYLVLGRTLTMHIRTS